MTKATITIYAATYREAACSGGNDETEAAFDAARDRIFGLIAERAQAQGLIVEINEGRSHGPSYTVSAESYDDEEAAHNFMQSGDADFWSMY